MWPPILARGWRVARQAWCRAWQRSGLSVGGAERLIEEPPERLRGGSGPGVVYYSSRASLKSASLASSNAGCGLMAQTVRAGPTTNGLARNSFRRDFSPAARIAP